jgi:hypothetical protein
VYCITWLRHGITSECFMAQHLGHERMFLYSSESPEDIPISCRISCLASHHWAAHSNSLREAMLHYDKHFQILVVTLKKVCDLQKLNDLC